MSIAVGRSLELYYIDGRPDGMLTAELFNWTGHVLMAPRTQIAAALRRPEASYAGVYLLLGEHEGEPRAYVGEGEDIAARIRAHDVAKDWWASAVLVTTAGNKLNKAHVRYLEARMIEQASSVGRMPLDNGTRPARPTLSEADVAKMDEFLANLLIVLPAVRVDMFIQRVRPQQPDQPGATAPIVAVQSAPEARFRLTTPRHGIQASAVQIDGEFVVEAGSIARQEWVGRGTADLGYGQLHAELLRTGTLVAEGGHCVFTSNYAFRSPSAAAAVVNGRSSNGTIEWREVATGATYKDWEIRQLGVPGSPAT